MHKIVIVIPCFNEEKNIITTLKTIISKIQNYKEYSFQVLVVEDFSTDKSALILNSFKADIFSELQIIRNNKNLGIVRSTKKMFEAALKLNADFIIKCDMDSDFPHATLLDIFMNHIKNNQLSLNEIIVGERQIDNVKNQCALEIEEQAKMVLYLNENLNIMNYNPVSSGVLVIPQT